MLVHLIYRSSWYWGNFSELTHPPGQRRGRCPADRCRRSYTEDNGKVCYARDKARCHWRKWFSSSLCRARKRNWDCNSMQCNTMRSIFDVDETDPVLLINASNTFNALNGAAALHNFRVLCPTLATTYVINTYRQPARLFITGGED